MTLIRSVLALIAFTTPIFAQLSASSASWNGLQISFVSKIEPDGTLLHGGVVVGHDTVRHLISDNVHKREFSYDIVVEPAPDGRTALIRIERSTLRGRTILDSGWTHLELPKYPVIPNVHAGDTVALDLLVNDATGQKIVDYLTLRRAGDMDLKSEPRDFQLTDVDMTLITPRVSVNGKPLPDSEGLGFSGRVVWLYINGRGRYVMSLFPNQKLGYQKNGVVSRHGLLFHDGATEVRIECSRGVAPGGGAYNLYIKHQPDWRPPEAAPWTIGSSDIP